MIALIFAAALNVEVSQQTLQQTICHSGYSKSYRSHHRVTLPSRKGYVWDHRLPLALGGTSDPENIQEQTVEEAKRKDRLEKALQRAVCSGKVPLSDAQQRMLEWAP